MKKGVLYSRLSTLAPLYTTTFLHCRLFCTLTDSRSDLYRDQLPPPSINCIDRFASTDQSKSPKPDQTMQNKPPDGSDSNHPIDPNRINQTDQLFYWNSNHLYLFILLNHSIYFIEIVLYF
ncbi:hypothetical protein CROQUDRAFT_100293 [Cronartium quercuum f. sp. fusiforme G11]|uniref:Uncharacterized protein n=1 Tax=Cronartium quercuum f. sp. fusiforme G11 TaxID=708437 RepID=A0A9P6NAQ5_9BASI|nr:hypothetical protein CROQUDRAFT_100293 [Cronartium quercuum f. sp. fusiforme G11]